MFSEFSTIPTPPRFTALGLHALQHRGQEAAGIVTFDGSIFIRSAVSALLATTSPEPVIDRLPGYTAIGHVRYSTTRRDRYSNVQPLFADLDAGGFALCHNGNLTNALSSAASWLPRERSSNPHPTRRLFSTSSRAREQGWLRRPIFDALQQIEGAYALVV